MTHIQTKLDAQILRLEYTMRKNINHKSFQNGLYAYQSSHCARSGDNSDRRRS